MRGGTAASIRDLVHAAVMFNNDLTRIATFDDGFDLVKGIERLPLGWGLGHLTTFVARLSIGHDAGKSPDS